MFVAAAALILALPEEGVAVSQLALPVDALQFNVWVQVPFALIVAACARGFG
jgi:hypothetical protein